MCVRGRADQPYEVRGVGVGIRLFARICRKDAVRSLLLRLGGPSGHRLGRRGEEEARVVFWRC